MKNYGFFRAIAASPAVHIADCNANADEIIKILQATADEQPDLVVFPEMSITGYTCADLFHSSTLLEGALDALATVAAATDGLKATVVVGMPLAASGTLYNCAVVISGGKVTGVVPKTYIPNYNEFYEKRWWAPAPETTGTITVLGTEVPFGSGLLFSVGGTPVGIEICEDLWTPVPPAAMQPWPAPWWWPTYRRPTTSSENITICGSLSCSSRRDASAATYMPRPATVSRQPTWCLMPRLSLPKRALNWRAANDGCTDRNG